MVKGERDFTTRSVASVSSASVIGGKLIFREDFETLNAFKGSTDGGAITTTDGEVINGDASLKLSSTYATGPRAYTVYFPNPTQDIIAAEIIYKPLDAHMGSANLGFTIYDGTRNYQPGVWINDADSVLRIILSISPGAAKLIHSFDASGYGQYPHLLYLRINLATATYELVQYDGVRLDVHTEPLYSQADTITPQAKCHFYILAKTGLSTDISIDDMQVAYEDA